MLITIFHKGGNEAVSVSMDDRVCVSMDEVNKVEFAAGEMYKRLRESLNGPVFLPLGVTPVQPKNATSLGEDYVHSKTITELLKVIRAQAEAIKTLTDAW